MISYAIVALDGYVKRAGVAPSLPDDATALPNGTDPQDILKMRLLDGQFVMRPSLAAPIITPVVPLGQSLLFSDLPTGTVAVVTDQSGGYDFDPQPAVAGVIDITLVAPIRYVITLTPPRPYLPLEMDVDLS